jgi:cyclopropane-fatty-acyl-phospholipid synthase
VANTVCDLVREVLGDDLPVAVEAYDGSRLEPRSGPAAGRGTQTTIIFRSADALRRIVFAPGELGLARAYVAGDVDVDGDIYEVLDLHDRIPDVRLAPAQLVAAAKLLGRSGVRPLRPPAQEARLRGRRHSRERDAAAISHHYDVSNRFYEILLGPSLTYSCAVWESPETRLEDAQAAKHELICRKLGLRAGMRLLDIGCGWGSMVIHAAQHHGVEAVGVTISRNQADLAAKRVADAGLGGRVTIRYEDYRDVSDGPYDAISSIGMFEHVGLSQLATYFEGAHALLRGGGRFLNHGIARTPAPRARFARASFIDRYVFPDGELHEVGSVVSAMQRAGFEARHSESLREHYALTCRAWVRNLEASWDEAVAEAGEARARVWRLYLAGAARNFEAGRTQIHQVLGVRLGSDGASGLPLRPSF